MEPQFNVRCEMDRWLTQFNQQGHLTLDDFEELRAHFLDSLEALEHMGLSPQEAFLVAKHRLGNPQLIQAEFHKLARPFTTQPEPVLLLLGAFGFFIGKNLIQILCDGVLVSLAGIWGDSLKTVALDAAFCGILFGLVVMGLLWFSQYGGHLMSWSLRQLQRWPIGSITLLALLMGGSSLSTYFLQHQVDTLNQIALTSWKYTQFWQVHQLFWMGLALSGLVLFLHVLIQHYSTGHATLFDWLGQTSDWWRLIAGFCGFVCCLGISLAFFRLLHPGDEWFRFYASALVGCLVNGILMARRPNDSLLKRSWISVGPAVIWYGLALVVTSVGSLQPSYLSQSLFIERFFGAALVGYLLSLLLPTKPIGQQAAFRQPI